MTLRRSYAKYQKLADGIVALIEKSGPTVDVLAAASALGHVAATIGLASKNAAGVREVLTSAYDDATDVGRT